MYPFETEFSDSNPRGLFQTKYKDKQNISKTITCKKGITSIIFFLSKRKFSCLPRKTLFIVCTFSDIYLQHAPRSYARIKIKPFFFQNRSSADSLKPFSQYTNLYRGIFWKGEENQNGHFRDGDLSNRNAAKWISTSFPSSRWCKWSLHSSVPIKKGNRLQFEQKWKYFRPLVKQNGLVIAKNVWLQWAGHVMLADRGLHEAPALDRKERRRSAPIGALTYHFFLVLRWGQEEMDRQRYRGCPFIRLHDRTFGGLLSVTN